MIDGRLKETLGLIIFLPLVYHIHTVTTIATLRHFTKHTVISINPGSVGKTRPHFPITYFFTCSKRYVAAQGLEREMRYHQRRALHWEQIQIGIPLATHVESLGTQKRQHSLEPLQEKSLILL